MSALVPCPACSRHVRAAEVACPFCEAALPNDLAERAVPAATRRLERLAAFTFAASVAVGAAALAGCDAGDSTGGQESNIGAIAPMYGAPPDIEPEPPPPEEDAGCAPRDDAGGPNLDAGPAPPDCEEFDAGGIFPMYGMPPPQR